MIKTDDILPSAEGEAWGCFVSVQSQNKTKTAEVRLVPTSSDYVILYDEILVVTGKDQRNKQYVFPKQANESQGIL